MSEDLQPLPPASETVSGSESAAGLCHTCFALAVQNSVCVNCGADQKEVNRNRRALPIGTLVANKYVIGKVLGSGSFGITYLAQDQALARRVALKEYFPNGLAVRQADRVQVGFHQEQDELAFKLGLTKFFQEGQTLAKFSHTGIVRVYDVLRANESAYMAMEYVQGQSLKQYVQQRGGRLSQTESMKIMSHVQEAIDEVHRANVVHRDIKPDNIYITPENRVLLLDFGGAQLLQTDQEHGQAAMFAYGYAAPEQYAQDSDKIGPWTDVYAYSATFYKLLTGKTLPSAWEREADSQLLDWSLAPDVGGPLRQAIEKGLVLKPELRLQSLAAFDSLLYGAPGSQTDTMAKTSSVKPVKVVVNSSVAAAPSVAAAASSKNSSFRLLAVPIAVFLMGVSAWWMWGMSNSKETNSVQAVDADSTRKSNSDLVEGGGEGQTVSPQATENAPSATNAKAAGGGVGADASSTQSSLNLEKPGEPNAANAPVAATVQPKLPAASAKDSPKTVAAKSAQNNNRVPKSVQNSQRNMSQNKVPSSPAPASSGKTSRQDDVADTY